MFLKAPVSETRYCALDARLVGWQCLISAKSGFYILVWEILLYIVQPSSDKNFWPSYTVIQAANVVDLTSVTRVLIGLFL